MQRALFATLFVSALATTASAQDMPTAASSPPGPNAEEALPQRDDEPARDEFRVPIFPLRENDRASVPGRGGADPWGGLVITVTPAGDEASPGLPEAGPTEEGGLSAKVTLPPVAPIEIDPFAPAPDDADMPSLWTSLELALGDGGIDPTIPRVVTQPVRNAAPVPTPTSFDMSEGPARFTVLTSVTTAQPVSSALASQSGGGSGEVKGRVGYVMDNLSLYGTGGVGAAESTGTISVYDSALFGTSYSVPLAPFGLGAGDKVGARIEVDRAATTATSVELRSADGKVERFISVERSAPADSEASGVVRAGVTGKF